MGPSSIFLVKIRWIVQIAKQKDWSEMNRKEGVVTGSMNGASKWTDLEETIHDWCIWSWGNSQEIKEPREQYSRTKENWPARNSESMESVHEKNS